MKKPLTKYGYQFGGSLGKYGQGIKRAIEFTATTCGEGFSYSKGKGIAPAARKLQFNLRKIRVNSKTKPPKNNKKRKRKAIPPPRRVAFEWKQDLKERVHYLDVGPRLKINHDTGRRALLVDFDALFLNAHVRRLEAFAKMIADSDEFSDAIEFNSIIYSEHGDRCDRECIEALMEEAEIPKSQEKVKELLTRLDDAFQAGHKLIPNLALNRKLREAAKHWSLGIFHYGSQSRMLNESTQAGLDGMIVPKAVVTVKQGDVAPYLKSWMELYADVGVTPSQTMIVLSDCALNPINSDVIVAHALGVRSLICIESKPPRGFDTDVFQATFAIPRELVARGVSFKRMMGIPEIIDGPKRVLAIRKEKRLWNSATLLYRWNGGSKTKIVLVRFDDNGQLSWVKASNTRHLEHGGYLEIMDDDFWDLLDPGDVDPLTFIKRRKKDMPVVNLV